MAVRLHCPNQQHAEGCGVTQQILLPAARLYQNNDNLRPPTTTNNAA